MYASFWKTGALERSMMGGTVRAAVWADEGEWERYVDGLVDGEGAGVRREIDNRKAFERIKAADAADPTDDPAMMEGWERVEVGNEGEDGDGGNKDFC